MVLRECSFSINNDYETPKDDNIYEYNFLFFLQGYSSQIKKGIIKFEIGRGSDFSSALDYAYNNAYNRLKHKHAIIVDIFLFSDYRELTKEQECEYGHAFFNVSNIIDFLIGLCDDEDVVYKDLVINELFKLSLYNEDDKLKLEGLMYLVEHDHNKASHELGCYYEKNEDYEQMIKYYEASINKYNDIESMHNLAFYYEMINQHNELAKKYYLMILDNDCNDVGAIFKLGRHYYINENDKDTAKKYFSMTIEKCNNDEKEYYNDLISKIK